MCVFVFVVVFIWGGGEIRGGDVVSWRVSCFICLCVLLHFVWRSYTYVLFVLHDMLLLVIFIQFYNFDKIQMYFNLSLVFIKILDWTTYIQIQSNQIYMQHTANVYCLFYKILTPVTYTANDKIRFCVTLVGTTMILFSVIRTSFWFLYIYNFSVFTERSHR